MESALDGEGSIGVSANLAFMILMFAVVGFLQCHELVSRLPPVQASSRHVDSRLLAEDSLSLGEQLLTEKDLIAALAAERKSRRKSLLTKPTLFGSPERHPSPEHSVRTRDTVTTILPSHLERERETFNVDVPQDVANYLLQAGAFREAAKADALRARIGLLGLPSKLDRGEIVGDYGLYRVRLGPFANWTELEQTRGILRSGGIQSIAVSLVNTL